MNQTILHQPHAKLIRLTQGKFAIVDAADYERLAQHKWCAVRNRDTFYAARASKGRQIKMHREILKAPADMQCDHKNHNGLDNRRCNLRLCTAAQNQYNRKPHRNGTSKYKGVYWSEQNKKWCAEICHNGRMIRIGHFDYELDAVIAYDDKAAELFGEFAYLNCQWQPQLFDWIEQSYLFNPTNYELAPAFSSG